MGITSFIRVELADAFERMFVRGGRKDRLVSFVIGQIYLIVISVVFSALAVRYVFSMSYDFLEPLWFLEILGEFNTMTFLAFLIWSHEISHLALFRRYNVPVIGMIFPPIGGLMVPGQKLNPHKSIQVALAGPMTGIAALPMIVTGLLLSNPIWTFMGIVWAGVNLINLLPFFPLDGGWVVKELLRYWFNSKASKIIAWGITTAGLAALSLFFPDPRVLVLQITLIGMLVLVDFLAGRAFIRFSSDYLQVERKDIGSITGRQVLGDLIYYLVIIAALILLIWIGIEHLL